MGISKRAWQVAGSVAGGAGLFGSGVAIGRLLRLDAQRGDYRRAWEDHNLAALKRLSQCDPKADEENRPFVYVALGDSSVQGVGASKITESYPARLASAISSVIDREVILFNVSLSGATVESVELTQIPQLRGLGLLDGEWDLDLVTLSIGGNDVMLEDMTAAKYAERLKRVLDCLPEKSLVSSIPSFSIMPQETRAQEMSDLAVQAAKDGGHVVVDLRSLTLEYSLPTYTFGYHAADFFHPNSAAYAVWAQCFADEWAASRRLPAPVVADATEWLMCSDRVAQSEYDD
ncbi:SGNH/GDSL hydrolase family protein [Schaalia vaccimaxillae]|uniref:SGNH/GDSL hydrolase family protein n=1 Tax=Schaalia vaccimaxillae TaxID=183916 RepID=UPI0003B5EC07|nr:SGNH/GDSL hydrolase family protein [Schaalia vaccimaxillae]